MVSRMTLAPSSPNLLLQSSSSSLLVCCGDFLVALHVSYLPDLECLSMFLTHRIPSLQPRTLQHILMEPFPFLRRFPSQLLLFFRVPRKHVVVVFQVGKMAEFLKGTGCVIWEVIGVEKTYSRPISFFNAKVLCAHIVEKSAKLVPPQMADIHPSRSRN